MALPDVIGAYQVELDQFDRALEDPVGIRIWYGKDEKTAKQTQMRYHQARSLVRKENKRLYEKTDPKHGTSPYDHLVVRVLDDVNSEWWIYIERRAVAPDRVESLSEIANG